MQVKFKNLLVKLGGLKNLLWSSSYGKRLSFAVVLLGYLCAYSGGALASPLSTADQAAINGDWVHWVSAVSSCSGSGGTLDKFMQAIALHESGGDPKAGSDAHASGKYQFEPETWASWSKSYYAPALHWAAAKEADESVQDAVMYLGFVGIYNSVGGDPFKMAVEHYYPAALTNPSVLDKVPYGGNTLTPREFGNLISDAVNTGTLKTIAGKSESTGDISKIKLNYSAAPDFSTWLAKAGGAPSEQTNSVVSGCGGAAGNFVSYDQCDPKWGSKPYGSSTICASGCGPSSVAEVVATLADKSITPDETAKLSMSSGGYVPGAGTSWGFFSSGPEHWGLHATELGVDLNKAIAFIKAGGLVIAAGTGAAPFTSAGHVLVLRGIAGNGNIQVGDPDTEHKQTDYPPDVILSAGLHDLVGVTK